MVRKNTDYYDQRTSHGSTLSFIAHAGILADIDPDSSWERYMVALESDVGDVQGGTTQEGIHMGVMAGTLDLIQRGYLGHRHPRRGAPLRPEAGREPRRPVVLPCGSAGRRWRSSLEDGSADGRRPGGRLRPARRGPGRGRDPGDQGRRTATPSASEVLARRCRRPR